MEKLSSSLIENIQWVSTRTSCCCKWKSSVHVAVQKPLTCLWAKVNWDFNRSDLTTSWQDTPCWNCNSISQFVPVNTFTAVRSVSCIYLAGITLGPCGSPLDIVIRRSAAVLQGLVLWTSSLSKRLGLFTPPSYSWVQDLCFVWRPSV